MKKILSFLFIVGLIISCDPKPEIEPDNKIDPNAMILLKPAKGVQLRSAVPNLTALEIVEQALNIKWKSYWFGNQLKDEPLNISRGFGDHQKDYQIPALKMLGIDIISQQGDYYRDFIYGYEVFITDANNDSIAYVPDSVIANARILIEAAYNDGNYEEVYRLFNEAFTFLPIPK